MTYIQDFSGMDVYGPFAREVLLVYGRSMFNPAKAIAEIEALDSRRKPWQDDDAGDVPVQE